MENKAEEISISKPSLEGNWRPTIGPETHELLRYLNLPKESEQRLIDETAEILSKCGNPQAKTNSEIGLVFGYVQSGKTMSFTTLTALAKDNGYQMIIIIAGISINLVDQSFTRLERDLRIDSRTDLQWLSFKNPKRSDTTTKNLIATALSEYKDDTFPEEERRTILITVMKQASHLPNLQELLQTLDLHGVPALIIDDEGDQHSMNTKERKNARKGESNTSVIHQRIVDLRNCLPHHTLIQYTATPQAPLFVDIMNNLSPNFVQLLTPGPGYTGGKIFFNKRRDLVNVIDDIDPNEDLKAPPDSFVLAMQIFYLGVVKGMRNKEGKKRSMMIHPSQFTYTHAEYFRFAINIKNHFVEILNLPDANPDKVDLLNEFRVAYEDLKKTTDDLPSFDELTANRLRHAINTTVIQSLNSNEGNKTTVDWRNNYSFILIGGQAMDRGFTVEGLTVTYMPRSVGTGNADTIQQRARFFGYKEGYLGYCRVFLDQRALATYIQYVEHEEDMRKRLSDHKAQGKDLNDWYREVFLASDLNLSRTSVFSKDFERTILGGEWILIKKPHYSHIEANRQVLNHFIDQNSFEQNKIPKLTVRLDKVYQDLICLLRYNSSADSADYASLIYFLASHLETEPDEVCTLFLMSKVGDPRERSLTEKDNVNQLFQGANPNYVGDRAIQGPGITFQIHVLDLLVDKKVAFSNVVSVATFIPEEIGKDIIRWE